MVMSGNDPYLLKGNILSGKELHNLCLKNRKPGDSLLIHRGGQKEYAPDGSWLQTKRLEKVHEERRAILHEEKVAKCGYVAIGAWNEKIGLVIVTKKSGQKAFQHVGYNKGSDIYLYPEESLFLMETGDLEVYYHDLPLSIERAFAIFQGETLNLDQYHVYAHLSRLGYIVLRTTGQSDITEYERLIKLDQHLIDRYKRKIPELNAEANGCSLTPRKKVKLDHDAAIMYEKSIIQGQKDKVHSRQNKHEVGPREYGNTTDCAKYLGMKNGEKDMLADTDVKMDQVGVDMEEKARTKEDLGAKVNNDTNNCDLSECEKESVELSNEKDKQSSSKQPVTNSTTSSKHLDFGGIEIPDVSDCKNECNFTMSENRYLPASLGTDISGYAIDLEKVRSDCGKYSKKRLRDGQSLTNDQLEFSFKEMSTNKESIQASNWLEYKQLMSERTSDVNCLLNSPVGLLWEGDVKPLVQPSMATSTGALLKRLQIIENVHVTKEKRCEKDATSPKVVMFDVHQPESRFKKSCPGIPSHRVVTTRFSAPPPSLADISRLCGQYTDSAPLLWAAVDNGDISFYSFTDICLPNEISIG